MAWIPPYVAQVPAATMAVALGANRSSHSLVVIGCPVAGLLPKPDQYPSSLIFSLGMDPSTTRTNGSKSPRSALKNHSRKSSAPPVGPHSKSINGQCTATWGSPGNAPSAISSTLGWVAAVNATESPSQLRPALIQRTWISVSSALTAASESISQLSGTGARSLRCRSRPSAYLRSAVFRSTPAVRRCQRFAISQRMDKLRRYRRTGVLSMLRRDSVRKWCDAPSLEIGYYAIAQLCFHANHLQ